MLYGVHKLLKKLVVHRVASSAGLVEALLLLPSHCGRAGGRAHRGFYVWSAKRGTTLLVRLGNPTYSDKAVLQSKGGCRSAVFATDLIEDVGEVGIDRLHTDL